MDHPFSFLKPVVTGFVRCQFGGAGPVDETADMLLHRMAMMPPYLSWPMAVLTIVFDAGTVLTTGRRFHALSPERQVRRVQAWKASPFGIARDFIQFYEKMGTFIYFAGQEKAVR